MGTSSNKYFIFQKKSQGRLKLKMSLEEESGLGVTGVRSKLGLELGSEGRALTTTPHFLLHSFLFWIPSVRSHVKERGVVSNGLFTRT